ncbi:hypothetical protein LINPERHAP2_LOCUS37820 [Linum perenne]
MFEGPWLVGDHYVVSEEWRPNFEPGYSQVNTMKVWIRLPGLPLENFDAGILRIIGDKIGRTVRVDGTTLFGNRGNYARVCVEIDLREPLISKYRLHRRVRRIEYEGLHKICFHCGRYGHEQKGCSSLRKTNTNQEIHEEAVFDNPIFQETETQPEIDEDFGPWMKVKKNMRRRRSKKDDSKPMNQNAAEGKQFVSRSKFDALVGEEADPELEEASEDIEMEEDRLVIPSEQGDKEIEKSRDPTTGDEGTWLSRGDVATENTTVSTDAAQQKDNVNGGIGQVSRKDRASYGKQIRGDEMRQGREMTSKNLGEYEARPHTQGTRPRVEGLKSLGGTPKGGGGGPTRKKHA